MVAKPRRQKLTDAQRKENIRFSKYINAQGRRVAVRQINKDIIASKSIIKNPVSRRLFTSELKTKTIRGKKYFVVTNPKGKIIDKIKATRGMTKLSAFQRFNRKTKSFDPNITAVYSQAVIERRGKAFEKKRITAKVFDEKKYGKVVQVMCSMMLTAQHAKTGRTLQFSQDGYGTIHVSSNRTFLKGFSFMIRHESRAKSERAAEGHIYGRVKEAILKAGYNPYTTNEWLYITYGKRFRYISTVVFQR